MRGKKRRGFSMIEMTLVIALIGILMTVAVVAFLPKLKEGKETATKATMNTINGQLLAYKASSGVFPPGLAQLVPNYLPKLPKDGWKKEFYYAPQGLNGRPFDLISGGEDQQIGTTDDIDWAKVEQE
jgi:general secretion pathway protein G